MVARVTIPHSISRALNYNEKKVQEEKAECIYAHNFLKEADYLNFYEKLQRFQQLINLNDRATTNTIHISLNFDPSENLDKETLTKIAIIYMQKIGFGNQPFLVYQHRDAGHPHIHIVSTNIQKTGKRISVHNIGRNQSTKARKEIEIQYNLVKAQQQKQILKDAIQPLQVTRVNYGKSETKGGITNVLNAVIDKYKYTSLAELNAILKLYNIQADRGSTEGIIYKKHGLVYRVLDEKGNKIGVPIKASSIYSNPTLKNLEKKFKLNEPLKQTHKKHLKTSIDWIMVKPPKGLNSFKLALEKERIGLVVRQNDAGQVFGLTYIDHTTRCVFNGSDIGKEYSAKAMLEKLGEAQQFDMQKKSLKNSPLIENERQALHFDKHIGLKQQASMLDIIITPTEEFSQMPYELRKKKKRKPH